MIIQALLDLIYGLVSLLTAVISIPTFPEEVTNVFDKFLEYIGVGVGIVANYTHYSYLMVLVGILLAIDIGVGVYHLVMFVLKKIPFLGIK